MRFKLGRRPATSSNPAFVYRLACDVISLGYMFCIVPVLVQNVLLPASVEYLTMTIALIVIILPANMFFIFFFDKWTPRVLYMLLPCVILNIIANGILLVASNSGGASIKTDVLFVTSNIICLAGNFACASVARSTKENILLFWNINQPVKEKPATYVALLIVAAMIALCIVEWRLVYLIASLLVLVLPVMFSKVQRIMKTRLVVDPDVVTRHMNAFTAPVFTRSAIVHVVEKVFLAFLFTFLLAAIFSSPMFRACIDVLLPGGSTMPLSSTLLVYIFSFFALGAPLLVLFWWLMRRHHGDIDVREKIAVLCTFFAIIGLIFPVAFNKITVFAPPLVYLVWSIVNNAFFSMEMLYIFLIIYDFIPSKRVPFLGQSLPILIVTIFFLWIYPMADTLSTTSTFFIPGIVAACAILVYYSLLPRARLWRLRVHKRADHVATQREGSY